MIKYESALVLPVADAEPLVRHYRDRYDPTAALGVPAHITVLYPFIPPQELTPVILAQLAQLFGAFMPFEFMLAELRRFPDVLYLAPMPEAPFRTLTQRVTTLFPEYPPYGGIFDEVIPHLTLAQMADTERLEQIKIDFQNRCSDRLPFIAQASEVHLMDNTTGIWHVRTNFRLGSGGE